MMALEARIVGQDFARGEAVGGAAQGAGLAREHHRGQADSIAFQAAAHLGPVVLGDEEVAAVGNQGADLFGHAVAEIRVAGGECHDHGFGILAQQAEDPPLETLLHRTDLVHQSTAQAASGVSAAAVVSEDQRWRSMSLPKAGEIANWMAP